MKKILIILAVSLLIVPLSSCKSEEAAAVDARILEISDITLDSSNEIESIESSVDALSEKEQKSLDNLQILMDARQKLNVLLCEDYINSIPDEILLDEKCQSAIRSARNFYNSLSTDTRAMITNYNILEESEAALTSLKVQDVINSINAIGVVTLKSEDKINTAKTGYDKLTQKERSLVSNSTVLTDAVTKLSELKTAAAEKEKRDAIAKLNPTFDKVTGTTWYYHPRQPYYTNTRSYVLPYIGKSDTSTWLRLEFHYTDDDWIFWHDLTIVIDDEKINKSYDYFDITRDNGSGDVWEYIDIPASDTDTITMLQKIADSNETIVRFQGDDYHYDLTISSKDKQAIKEVITAYNAMK